MDSQLANLEAETMVEIESLVRLLNVLDLLFVDTTNVSSRSVSERKAIQAKVKNALQQHEACLTLVKKFKPLVEGTGQKAIKEISAAVGNTVSNVNSTVNKVVNKIADELNEEKQQGPPPDSILYLVDDIKKNFKSMWPLTTAPKHPSKSSLSDWRAWIKRCFKQDEYEDAIDVLTRELENKCGKKGIYSWELDLVNQLGFSN